MRILFIPGFGEDETIFSKLHPLLPGDKIVLDSWKIIGNVPVPAIDVVQLAKSLIAEYDITNKDLIIGHSMGGWIALHIKQLAYCRIVQIASWTNPDKVVLPVSNPKIIYWAVRNNLYFNPFVKWLILQLSYKHQPSKEMLSYIFDRLIYGNKDNIINQLRIVLTPVSTKIILQPDIRIHSKNDTVVKYPDEPFYETPGDHFSIYTHPEEVYKLIGAFLTGASFNMF